MSLQTTGECGVKQETIGDCCHTWCCGDDENSSCNVDDVGMS